MSNIKPSASDISSAMDIAVQHHQSGRFREAENIYRRVLSIDPGHAEASHLIGVMAHQAGKNDDAVDFITKALSSKPDYFEAHNSLGLAFNELKKFDEAIDHFQKALSLKADFSDAMYNLGRVLYSQGNFDGALVHFRKSLSLYPENADCCYMLALALIRLARFDEAITAFQHVLEVKTDFAKSLAHLAAYAWVRNDLQALSDYLSQLTTGGKSDELAGPYYSFLSKLLHYREQHLDEYVSEEDLPVIYALGDSHCLTPAHTKVLIESVHYRVEPKIVIGCKAWHLGNDKGGEFKDGFDHLIKTIPTGALVVVMFGEIDCRINEGIMKNHKKTGSDLTEEINCLVEKYIEYVLRSFEARELVPLFYGVPAPFVDNTSISAEDVELLSAVVQKFNQALADKTAQRGIPFLDVYSLIHNESGQSSGAFHIDNQHVYPAVFADLCKKCSMTQ